MRTLNLSALALLLGLSTAAAAAPLPREQVRTMVAKLRTKPRPIFAPGASGHGTIKLSTGEDVVVERAISGLRGLSHTYEWRVHGVDGGDGTVKLLDARQRREIKALLEPHLGGEALVVSKVQAGAVKQELQAMKKQQRLQAMTPNERTIEALKQWTAPTAAVVTRRPELLERRREDRDRDVHEYRWNQRFANR